MTQGPSEKGGGPVDVALDPLTGDLLLTVTNSWGWTKTTIPAATLDFYQKQSAAIRAGASPSSPGRTE